jgi:hypothetical protein
MARRIKKSPSIVVRAKEVLREEFERNPNNPSRRIVRKTGLAYVFNTPGSRRTVKTHPMDSRLTKIRKVVTRTTTLKEGNRWTTITMDRISIHKRRSWIPPQLGKLAFSGKPDSKPIEILSLATAQFKHRAEVSEPSSLPLTEVAAFLLTLPIPKDNHPS